MGVIFNRSHHHFIGYTFHKVERYFGKRKDKSTHSNRNFRLKWVLYGTPPDHDLLTHTHTIKNGFLSQLSIDEWVAFPHLPFSVEYKCFSSPTQG